MVSAQSNHAKSLSGSQKQSNPAKWAQNSLTLSSPYLNLKVVHFYRVLSFQNYSKHVYTSNPIVSVNLQGPVPSSQYILPNTNGLLISDLRHLVNTSEPRQQV